MAEQRKSGKSRAAAARSATESPVPSSGRLGWRAVLDAHTAWQALIHGRDVAYGPRQVTVHGVDPYERSRLARCASLALAAHGYDAWPEMTAEAPTVVRIQVTDDGG